MSIERPQPEPAFALDMRELRSELTFEGGDLVMILRDGNRAVSVVASDRDAIAAAERLADLAQQFAELLRMRAGSRRPLARRAVLYVGGEPVPGQRLRQPPINGTQPIT